MSLSRRPNRRNPAYAGRWTSFWGRSRAGECNDVFKQLEARRRVAYGILSSIPGVKMKMPESGILAWVNTAALGTSDAVKVYLLKEAKILVNSGNHYGSQGEGYLRIVIACFKAEPEAVNAFYRIKSALTKLAAEKGII